MVELASLKERPGLVRPPALVWGGRLRPGPSTRSTAVGGSVTLYRSYRQAAMKYFTLLFCIGWDLA